MQIFQILNLTLTLESKWILNHDEECSYSRPVTSVSYCKEMKIVRNDFQEIFL